MAELIKNVITNQERQTLIDYLNTDDERADIRPDVTSKHPRWGIDDWPEHIVAKGLDKIFPKGYVVEEVTFLDSTIGLKPHTDNGSIEGTVGKTVMFLLDAEPTAHTVFFDNYFQGWTYSGAFFTRQKWTPYQYRLPGKTGELVYIEDLRDLLEQCQNNPDSVVDFKVNDDFIELLKSTIKKRSITRSKNVVVNKETGYIQAAPRINDYSTLTNYDPTLQFDKDFHEKYLYDIPLEDLHGLTLDSVLEWELNGVIVFDREMLHSSSSCHSRKKFITIFCHGL